MPSIKTGANGTQASKQVDYLFSFASPHLLYEQSGANSQVAQLFAACVVGRPAELHGSIRAALLALAQKNTALLLRPELLTGIAALAERYDRRVREIAEFIRSARWA